MLQAIFHGNIVYKQQTETSIMLLPSLPVKENLDVPEMFCSLLLPAIAKVFVLEYAPDHMCLACFLIARISNSSLNSSCCRMEDRHSGNPGNVKLRQR